MVKLHTRKFHLAALCEQYVCAFDVSVDLHRLENWSLSAKIHVPFDKQRLHQARSQFQTTRAGRLDAGQIIQLP